MNEIRLKYDKINNVLVRLQDRIEQSHNLELTERISEPIEFTQNQLNSFKNKLLYDLQFYACQYLSSFIEKLKLLLSGELGIQVLTISIGENQNKITSDYGEYVEYHGTVIDAIEKVLKTNISESNGLYPTTELRKLVDSTDVTVGNIVKKYVEFNQKFESQSKDLEKILQLKDEIILESDIILVNFR